MRGQLDLLPPSCRRQFRRRRQRRRWIAAYTCVLGVLITGFFAAGLARDSFTGERVRLRAEVEQRLFQNQEVSRMLAEIRDLRARMTRYNRLAWPVRMHDVVACIAEAIPNDIAVTHLVISPQREVTRTPPKPGVPAKETERRWLSVQIEGVAPGHERLSAIAASLDQHPLFGVVTLDFARPRQVDGVNARAFRVLTSIDLDAQYTFVDATTADASGGR
jgi:Tfp pilus assembly protein PilN